MRVRGAAFAVAALALIAGAGRSVEITWTDKSTSPDGSKKVMVQARDSDEGEIHEVMVQEGKDALYKDTFLPARAVRYFRFSWSQDSKSLIIGEGYKGSMDLTLIHFANGKPQIAHIDGGNVIHGPMLKALPFRDVTKSDAPVGRVAWRSIRWGEGNHCEMIYVFSGIGYEGESTLGIDWPADGPALKILKISPNLDTKNLDDI